MPETVALVVAVALFAGIISGLVVLWLRATRRARRPPEVAGDGPVRYSYFGHIANLISLSTPDAGTRRSTHDEGSGDA